MVNRFAGGIWDNFFAGNIWNKPEKNTDSGFDPINPPDVNKIDPYWGAPGWQIMPNKAIGPDGTTYL